MKIKVTVVSGGRFHAFELADQLRQRESLLSLYTMYPKIKVDSRLQLFSRTFPWIFTPYMLAVKSGWENMAHRLGPLANDSFDRWVSRHLEPSDVVVALSGYGLHTRRSARRLGALTVCDRGSSHLVCQVNLLRDEYARYGLPYKTDKLEIERELQEYAEADLITVPSSFAYESFLDEGVPIERLAKIPYGVDLSLFHPVPKEDEVFRVLYVGQLSVQKGIAYLLEAFEGIGGPGIELVLIGGISQGIQSVLDRNADKFKYLGFIPRHKLKYYYSQGSVLVQPSIQEGLSLVQAQAMACGLPLISTTNTGAADLFTDGVEGFIVPIRDPRAIRDKILYLYENPEIRERMGQAALQRVRQLGGWDTYGQLALETYKAFRKAQTEAT